MWLAFCDEGRSLHALMYAAARADSAAEVSAPQLLQPSAWWWQLRRGLGGEARLRDLIRQSLLALRALHAANVTHRRAPTLVLEMHAHAHCRHAAHCCHGHSACPHTCKTP